ncbi:MAG TPA: hypothetical protein DEF45_24575 [Rhodopirellula sp.]|nr:hypothetical protein [Rhodopirellula sp.]
MFPPFIKTRLIPHVRTQTANKTQKIPVTQCKMNADLLPRLCRREPGHNITLKTTRLPREVSDHAGSHARSGSRSVPNAMRNAWL